MLTPYLYKINLFADPKFHIVIPFEPMIKFKKLIVVFMIDKWQNVSVTVSRSVWLFSFNDFKYYRGIAKINWFMLHFLTDPV